MVGRATHGNTIAEYLLIGGLCVLVAIPGLGAVAQAFGGVFATAQAIVSGQYNVANAARPPQQQQLAQAPGNPATGQTESPAAPATKAALSEAELMNPLDNAQLVEVGGASGATNTMAERIKQLVEQQLAEKNIPPSQAQALIDLANQGHQIGQVMSLIETASNSGLTEYKGQLYTRKQLSDLLDDTGKSPTEVASSVSAALSPDPMTQGKEILRFRQLYQQAEADNTPLPANIKQLVQTLSQNISINSEAVVTTVVWLSPPDGSLDVRSVVNSTHQDSGGICSAGNGADSGTQCQ